MKIFPLNILIVIVSFDYYYSNAIYSCKSPTGRNVDWFVVYKLPRMPTNRNLLIAQGRAYLYADGTSNEWTLLDHGIEHKQSAIGLTVGQGSDGHEEEGGEDKLFFTYNDQCPDEDYNFQRGHMKGVVHFDDNRGFWLIHSVPNFPILDRGGYEYPARGIPKGQSFLCITMNTRIFVERIAPLLHFSGANRCSGNLPQWIEQNAYMRAILHRQPYHLAYWENSFRREPLTSFNGHAFEAFFKSNRYNNKDLYSHVGNALEISNFLVQSYITDWPMYGCQNCLNYLHCPYKVRYITKICLNLQNVQVEFDTFFPQGPDHSKWAVSNGADSWVCIGDLNRQQSQLERGGGAVCFQNGIIANLFRQAACGVQNWCSRHRH